MKHVMFVSLIFAMVIPIAGCSGPGFYQAGKTTEQGQYDLQQCIHEAETYGYAGAKGAVRPATLTSLCMQARGYEYLDADKLPQSAERVKVAASFGEYWLIDGGATAATVDSALPEKVPQASPVDDPVPECIGYKAQRDEAGKLMLIPVYEREPAKDTNSQEQAESGE
jgi:hypothetical protein